MSPTSMPAWSTVSLQCRRGRPPARGGGRALRPVPGLAVRRCAATGVFPAGAASPTGEPVGNPLHHLQQQPVASGGCEPLDGCHHADRATARRGLPVPVRSQATL
jgi:hypothetical protein